MKRKLFFLLLSVLTESVFCQVDVQLSQYMLHNSSFNPAAVGESEMIDAVLQLRSNWVGFPGGGSTKAFSVSAPLKIADTKHGLGLSFFIDDFGGFTNKASHLQYAYKKDIGIGRLSIGADFGVVFVGFSGDSVAEYPVESEYHNMTSDPNIPTTEVSGMSFDMNLGVWYSTDDWYAGVSCLHLNEPIVKWNDATEFDIYRSVFLTGGLTYKLTDPRYVLKPSVLFKSDFSAWQLDLSTRVEYDNKFWGGMSVRYLDAVVFMAGINIAGGLSLGYSFEFPTNKLITASWRSHEVVLLYSFEYVFSKSLTKYKSIRFL